jgi:hypothetical protein
VHLSPGARDEDFADITRFDTATFRLDEPFMRSADATGRVTWRGNGRVVISAASIVRFARVEIAITEWANELAEVTLRSRGRHLVSWGDRRERRYFDLAHDAASHIAAVLATPSSVTAAA